MFLLARRPCCEPLDQTSAWQRLERKERHPSIRLGHDGSTMTVEPVIERRCPVDLAVQRPAEVVVRELVSSGIVKVELPAALDSRSERKLNSLRKLTGNNFDLKYDKGQVAANREAVSLLERYARGGQHPDLKVFAGKALPVARENLRMARNLRR